MFSLHDTNAIARNAHERMDRLHSEARVESSLTVLHTSSRIRIAGVVSRIAAWIEPQPAAGRVAALHRPRHGSD